MALCSACPVERISLSPSLLLSPPPSEGHIGAPSLSCTRPWAGRPLPHALTTGLALGPGCPAPHQGRHLSAPPPAPMSGTHPPGSECGVPPWWPPPPARHTLCGLCLSPTSTGPRGAWGLTHHCTPCGSGWAPPNVPSASLDPPSSLRQPGSRVAVWPRGRAQSPLPQLPPRSLWPVALGPSAGIGSRVGCEPSGQTPAPRFSRPVLRPGPTRACSSVPAPPFPGSGGCEGTRGRMGREAFWS